MATRFGSWRGLRWLPAAVLGLSIGLAQAQMPGEEGLYYGRPMLDQQERAQFQERLREAQTLEERRRLQDEHRQLIRRRAEARGLDPDGIYGYRMMTPEQRRAYHDRMRGLESAQERLRFREEHRRQMRQQILERLHRSRGAGRGMPRQGGGRG